MGYSDQDIVDIWTILSALTIIPIHSSSAFYHPPKYCAKLLLPIYKPALSARLIGSECVCACAVEIKVQKEKKKIVKGYCFREFI